MVEKLRACASCGTANDEDARFCEGCGSSLARVCGTCGVEASATARFCRGCGASLQTQPEPDAAAVPVRKTVTVMFADLAGSTSFEERVDAETAREVIGRYHDLLRTTAQRHRAGVTKYIGDGFMAVWGVPETGVDDAGNAVETAVELQGRFVDLATRVTDAHGVELAMRVAVNTGEVVIGEGDADIVGDALNVAARLEGECPRGHVVVGEETWRSTRGRHSYDSLGQVQVKGRTTPVAVYQWLARQTAAADAGRFVGRTDEVRRLQTALDDATAARAARMVTVIGDPGVGKTRLAAEFVAAQSGLRVIRTRCNVEETVALAPIVELLRSRDLDADVPIGAPERDRMLRALKGLADGIPGSVEESFWALRRFVEALAVDGPLLIVVDDIHWADTLLLDFVEHLVEWVSEVPVLVLALARPELREVRHDLVTVGRWVSDAVHVGGLDSAATAELAAETLGGARLPQELLARLPSSTGGNPLFVRELIGMLVDDEVLVQDPVGWRLTIDVDAITIPPTIHALLASRLERVDAADRRVLEIASVLGTDFSLGAVSVLAGRGAAAVKPSLDRLRRLALAQPSGAYVGDEPVWRFHHVLIRDVAYRRLLKSDRADLHERFADWVEAGGATLASDSDEMVARHLESAHGYRLDLGALDDRAGVLALRSARCYLASARRALDRDELVSAGAQAARGAALAAADDALRSELLLIGCEAFLSAGDVTACAPLIDDLELIAGEALAPWAICLRCQFVNYTDPDRLLEVDARLQEAIDEFGRRKDAAGLAKAHRVRAGSRGRLGRIGDSEADLLEALIAARQSGDQRQITAALSAAPSAALWGPSPVPKAGGRCLDVVRMQRMATAAPSLEATSLRHLAVLELLRGRPDKARTMLADARQIVADLGLRHGLMETELLAGIIESMVGDPVAAEPHFRTALDGLDALGVGADAGQAAALLARAVLAQGRTDEADSYAAESERLAGHNLKTAVAWRAVRAEIFSAQGNYIDAVALARDAVTVAAGTDLVLDHADACLALSRVLAAAGDAKGADAARRGAESLYAAKEVVGLGERVVEPVVAVASAPPPAATSRLAVINPASRMADALIDALNARDVNAAVGHYSDRLMYDDNRRISGDPVVGLEAIREATIRVLDQYSHFEVRILAVRGERLALALSYWSDDSGNTTTQLDVHELGEDSRIAYQGRFDEDDFEGAYRELERRYYAGEGAAYAANGRLGTGWIDALNQLDVEAARRLSVPDFRWLATPSALTLQDGSVDDVFRWLDERGPRSSSVRNWVSVVKWLSPTCTIVRSETVAIGPEAEEYEWSSVRVSEFRDGLLATVYSFDDDEDAAFAHADERMRATTSRLAVTNRATETLQAVGRAMAVPDVDAVIGYYSPEQFTYDDRRGLSGDPIENVAALRAAVQRVFEQFSHTEWRVLAVRGERLGLCRVRRSDNDGNETIQLVVGELGDDGLVAYEGRFDEDDFEGAYRELERRYYTGEGGAFAQGGAVATQLVMAMNRNDVDRAVDELMVPGFRPQSRSGSVFGDRSLTEWLASLTELSDMVASVRGWLSTICWLSPACGVCCFEREAVGLDGQHYAWTRPTVFEIRGGQVVSMCDFEPNDEAAVFAYAEELVAQRPSRLATINQATAVVDGLVAAHGKDADAVVALYSSDQLYDDRRRLGGDPIKDRTALRAAAQRIREQYPNLEARTLAVRGERLALVRSRWADDSGNESVQLRLFELGDDGRIGFTGLFDEDDFVGAYRELDRRYFAGEGAAFAQDGWVPTEWMIALNRNDFDRAFGELCAPEFRLENRSRSVFGERSAAGLRASFEELATMVTSSREWQSAICWLSPNWSVSHFQREAVGADGEQYAWTRLHVAESRGGRVTSMCEFDIEDEEAAFAYAEERVRAATSRLAITNRASQTWHAVGRAARAHDADGMAATYSEHFIYDDRRALGGNPLTDVRAAAAAILEQYSSFEHRSLAVRGEHLHLGWSRWSNDRGYETAHLFVHEVGDDGLICYEGRFDEDDFDDAYCELERRYYVGEGAAFAASGAMSTEWLMALNGNDFDRAFGELTDPEFRWESRSRSVFGDRSAAQVRASVEELSVMVASSREWVSAICWLSPTWSVFLDQREAVGLDGEQYAWTRLLVAEIRDGRLTSMCGFEPDDEDAAFAYAEERVRANTSRLAVANQLTEGERRVLELRNSSEFESAFSASIHEQFRVVDRRAMPSAPSIGRDASFANLRRLLADYPDFESVPLAVRGQRLALVEWRCRTPSGFEATYFNVHEADDNGQVIEQVRFDGDDFEGAYLELEKRYYAGEGTAFAETGAMSTNWVVALNQGDLDRAFGELSVPGLHIENRSRSIFPDRSAAELRASMAELNAMVASSRTWFSVVCAVAPDWTVTRFERRAAGEDGEQYAWTRLLVSQIRDGRLASMCEFEIDDEEAAFTYAEERVRSALTRLAVANRASEVVLTMGGGMGDHDLDATVGYFSDAYANDDRRRFSGDPIEGRAQLRAAVGRIFEQYSRFEGRAVAVRGELLALISSRWLDEEGNETANLHVFEVGGDGLICYEGRFDEDDFEGAYLELEQRYYAGEGAAFAAGGGIATDYVVAINRGDLDRLFGEVIAPDFRTTSRSLAVFGDRSAAEYRASLTELAAMVASTRSWVSAAHWVSHACSVVRAEREALGLDGEKYSWTKVCVSEIRDGRISSMCEFDPGDEEAALVYAEERVRLSAAR